MNYYIADTHFRHGNVMVYDKRPWDDVDVMEHDMIGRWNKRVTDKDDVYILGDFCWGKKKDWLRLLSLLKGKKHIICGNHDPKNFPQEILDLLAEPPAHYMEIKDGDYYLGLCHYPIIAYHSDANPNTILLYGHVHNTIEFDAVNEAIKAMKKKCQKAGFDYKGNLYNCWCGFFDWQPATLEEILTNEQAHQKLD